MENRLPTRLPAWLLTLAMLLSLVPAMGVTASAGEMLPPLEVGTYQELRSAILRGKSRIKLKNDINTRDVYASGVGIPEDQMITIGYDEDITLDLNGCTLALETLVSGGISFFTVYGELEIKDSSPSQTGKITGKFPARLASMFHTRGGTLTLQSGTLMTYSNKNDVIKVGSSGGHVVINGGRICSGIWDTSSTSPCGYAVLAVTGFVDVEEMEVIINGGVFDGAVGFFPLSEFTCEKPRFHIYGGTFKKDVLLRCGQKTFKTHSPILEICGGSFEGGLKIYDWGMDLVGNAAQSYPPFKLLGGTFSCTMDLCYEKSSWGFYSPNLDQIIDALNYERMGPVFAAMFENSAIVKPSGTYTADYIGKGMDWAEREGYGGYYQMLLKGTAANPVKIVPNAWDLKEVLLDGSPIAVPNIRDGAAFKIAGSVPVYTVSTLGTHELVYRWYDLAKELKDAGWYYEIRCERGPRLDSIYNGSYTIANGICEWRYRLPNTPANIDAGQMAFSVNIKNPSGLYVSHVIYGNQYLLRYQVVQDYSTPIETVLLDMVNGDLLPSDSADANPIRTNAMDVRCERVVSQRDWADNGSHRNKTVVLEARAGFRFTNATRFIVKNAGSVTATYLYSTDGGKTCNIGIEAQECTLLPTVQGTLKNFYMGRQMGEAYITADSPAGCTFEIFEYACLGEATDEWEPIDDVDEYYEYYFYIVPPSGYAVRPGQTNVNIVTPGGYGAKGQKYPDYKREAEYGDWMASAGYDYSYGYSWSIGRLVDGRYGMFPEYERTTRTLYLNIKEPVAGENPNTDPSYKVIDGLPDDVTVDKFKWDMDKDTVFQAGKGYTLLLYLTVPKENPSGVWAEDSDRNYITVYINGVNCTKYNARQGFWSDTENCEWCISEHWLTPVPGAGAGVAVSGKITSYNPNNPTTIQLMQGGKEQYKTTIAKTTGSGQVTQNFSIPAVAAGTYDLVVTKSAHLSYTVKGVIVANGELDLTKHGNAAIRNITLLCGDINGDGSINEDDVSIIRYANNINKSTADADNKLADINGDGSVNEDDVSIVRYSSHINKGVTACTYGF